MRQKIYRQGYYIYSAYDHVFVLLSIGISLINISNVIQQFYLFLCNLIFIHLGHKFVKHKNTPESFYFIHINTTITVFYHTKIPSNSNIILNIYPQVNHIFLCHKSSIKQFCSSLSKHIPHLYLSTSVLIFILQHKTHSISSCDTIKTPFIIIILHYQLSASFFAIKKTF